ncbi:MAG: ATP-dependent helicase [Bryobacterales bacterium]|nr:ATP-dependent helicase [Bryobacterales bacterium]
MSLTSADLSGFQSARPALPVFCHLDFLDQLERERQAPTGKRASLLMQRMLVDASRLHFKATHGPNRGWRRSRLGGNSGSHFYAWWTVREGIPLQQESSFSQAPEGAIFLRAIRHHDDHTPLAPASLDEYLPLTVPESRGNIFGPAPWTHHQSRFLKTGGTVRVLKGHPGSGKTTALLHAADSTHRERVLYLTFSSDLAAVARDYFDRYCPRESSYSVLTIPVFLQQLLGRDLPLPSPTDARARFHRDVLSLQRPMGAWSGDLDALYDEMFAHLVGAAMPEKAGRFPGAQDGLLPEKTYRSQRDPYLGPPAAGLVIDTARRLARNLPDPAAFASTYFPELALAWEGAQALCNDPRRLNQHFLSFEAIAVDECQDLTPLESYVVIALARALKKRAFTPLLLAGDEAQTVRPTDFEWAWLHDMLHHLLATPEEFKLSVNLRSPRRIAGLVNRVWDLYQQNLEKKDRPSGTGYAEIEDDSPDQVIYCTAPQGAPLRSFLQEMVHREGLAVIAMNSDSLDADLRPLVLTPREAKGLDFQSVCVLGAGQHLQTITAETRTRQERDAPVQALRQRLAIDQLRVALSRPSERLIWLDVNPNEQTVREAQQFLRAGDGHDTAPITIEALRQSLDEEALDVDERIQRCQQDARQLLDAKPDLAWSRAHQALSLARNAALTPGTSDTNPELQRTAASTLAEVCFRLAMRRVKLAPELGKPDLFQEAIGAALATRSGPVARVIGAVSASEKMLGKPERLQAVVDVISAIGDYDTDLPAWLTQELVSKADGWVRELEIHLAAGSNAVLAARLLPRFFRALQLPGHEARSQALIKRCTDLLLKDKKHRQVLDVLRETGTENTDLMAQCHEALEEYELAAMLYRKLGNQEKLLACYRATANFEGALQVVRGMKTHAAKESLEWLSNMQKLIEKRPANFNRVMTAAEKKLLESTLEQALGVKRKKPAAKKAAAAGAAPKPRKVTTRKKDVPF